MKVLIVCSSGGHFTAAQQLRSFWGQHERVWVTFKTGTTESLLTDEKVYWAYSPTNRHVPNLMRNLGLAWSVLHREKPDLVLTTGAGVAVPFLLLGKRLGSQTVFIESITRLEKLSLSARLVRRSLDALYVHWPQLQALYPEAELVGSGVPSSEPLYPVGP